MKYSEFKKAVEGLSKKYKVKAEHSVGFLSVYYKNYSVLSINLDFSYEYKTGISGKAFNALPFSHKLYMLSAELAMTPPDERKDVQLWAVRAKAQNSYGEYWWVAHNPTDIYEQEDGLVSETMPEDTVNCKYRMPLELAKKHLTAFRELVKVEDK